MGVKDRARCALCDGVVLERRGGRARELFTVPKYGKQGKWVIIASRT